MSNETTSSEDRARARQRNENTDDWANGITRRRVLGGGAAIQDAAVDSRDDHGHEGECPPAEAGTSPGTDGDVIATRRALPATGHESMLGVAAAAALGAIAARRLRITQDSLEHGDDSSDRA